MNSVGNDIIALNAIDIPRTNNPRFYTKILAESEQQLYHSQFSAVPFHYFVWLLWSVKESAYKCLQRHQPHLVFSPVGTIVTLLTAPTQSTSLTTDQLQGISFNPNTCFNSTITFQSHTLYARSIIYGNELIHTVASVDADFSSVHWGIKRITQTDPESQSSAVRAFILDELHTLFTGTKLQVNKHESGYPFVMIDGKEIAVSLSHHQEWVGYAF